ncbi:hypothetical protein MMC09_000438 [Bachmanniomyces sp. S44760]|nr:hypothetical protein [Bachmanniomyces sp. S44760]
MTIPHLALFSKEDGTPELVASYTAALKKNNNGNDNETEIYDKMHHGWMGNRAFLEDDKDGKEFERA